jgi:hypothetical protein
MTPRLGEVQVPAVDAAGVLEPFRDVRNRAACARGWPHPNPGQARWRQRSFLLTGLFSMIRRNELAVPGPYTAS